jgi:hypothetical protein
MRVLALAIASVTAGLADVAAKPWWVRDGVPRCSFLWDFKTRFARELRSAVALSLIVFSSFLSRRGASCFEITVRIPH